MIHDGEHERLLERILVGELDETSATVVRALADCDQCQGELARLRALETRFRTESTRQREVVDLALRTSDARDIELVRRTLETSLASRAPVGRSVLLRWRGPLAVAAALLLLFAWWAWQGKRAPEPEVYLGDDESVEAVPGYVSFDWDGPDGVIFFVSVRAVAEGQAGVTLHEAEVLDSRWSPDAALTEDWPERVFIEFRSEDGLYSGSAIVSR